MERQIHNQVRLPNRVALQVVMQGIRVRFGRSLVTLSGVALGVAFLMSIFTGQTSPQAPQSDEANGSVAAWSMPSRCGVRIEPIGPG